MSDLPTASTPEKECRTVSLFGDPRYQYRETFFVLFNKQHRPTVAAIGTALAELAGRYESDLSRTQDGHFESITIRSPQDFSAMDITYVEGEDVTTQVKSVQEDMRMMTLTGDELKKLSKLRNCDARFDVFHFEQVSDSTDDEFEILDPGGLLLVLERLARLCDGVVLDPQSQTLL